ncbi:MAG: hypothetical protein ACFFG0_00315 [Candidatus Thorarchaeota archaeon]
MKNIEDYPIAPPIEKILTRYKFSVGILDEDEKLLGYLIIDNTWTLNDKEDKDEKVDPATKKEICKILSEYIAKDLTPEFMEKLIKKVNNSWRE